ncbi:hypothetical protein HY640_04390 [Candidatus Woesearchaeota archaeon]|nr:hypothetical protein [Candidatus Woesearchaeota archaeon]
MNLRNVAIGVGLYAAGVMTVVGGRAIGNLNIQGNPAITATPDYSTAEEYCDLKGNSQTYKDTDNAYTGSITGEMLCERGLQIKIQVAVQGLEERLLPAESRHELNTKLLNAPDGVLTCQLTGFIYSDTDLNRTSYAEMKCNDGTVEKFGTGTLKRERPTPGL